MQGVLTVSEASRLAKTVLEELVIWVVGEVDSYKESSAYKGVYFNLKDENSTIPCMYFKFSDVGYTPKNGEKVKILGTFSLYEKTGRFQMKVTKIEGFGEGDLLKQREELKKKLFDEGLFDESVKRAVPQICSKVGLITSKRGAAIEDFMTNVVKGYAGIEVYFVDTLVQGDTAAKSISEAFNTFNKLEDLDVVVLTRGGGSLEDLMCFNTEEVVQAIRSSKFPVISAVGHEVDFTLSDLASDLRVSTPTKAAEYISQAYIGFRQENDSLMRGLSLRFERILQDVYHELDLSLMSLRQVEHLFGAYSEGLEKMVLDIELKILALLEKSESLLASELVFLGALSPVSVLKRGYSIVYNDLGKVVNSVDSFSTGSSAKVLMSDGTMEVNVLRKDKNA